MTAKSMYSYVIYIGTTPEMLWSALTDPDLTAQYWGHRNVSDWRIGSSWQHQRLDGARTVDVSGTIIEVQRPTRLVHTWLLNGQTRPSQVAFDIEHIAGSVRLTVTHHDVEDPRELEATAAGWAKVLSSLKTFLETGRPLSGLW